MKNLFEPRPIDPRLIFERILAYNPEEESKKETYMKNCPHVEFEQDMGSHIPICKRDRCPCHCQCFKNDLEQEEGSVNDA